MKPLSTYTPSTAIAILCVGDAGTGKSRLGIALPDPGIMDCGGNLNSAVRVAPGKKGFVAHGFKDDNDKEIPEDERWNHTMKETKALLTHPEVKSFILDDLSNLCRWGLIHTEKQLVAAGINVKKEYLAKYQSFIPLLTNFITTLRVPGKLVMVTVHQIMEKEELTGRIIYKLDIPGRLADTLGGQFTDVWGTSNAPDPGSKIGAKYFIKTKPTGYHVGLKTSLDLEPSIDITGKSPSELWSLLAPKLSSANASK